jgi:hypothetical protein
VLFLRGPKGDFANIRAMDADVVQLVFRILGMFLVYVPVGPASPQETCEREPFRHGLFCEISTVEECIVVRNVLSLVNLRCWYNYSIFHLWTEAYC